MAEKVTIQEKKASEADSKKEDEVSPQEREAAIRREEKRRKDDPIIGERAGKKVCITQDEIELLINEAWKRSGRGTGEQFGVAAGLLPK